ncbi:hypothetical protein [Methyloglobulus sp.]|uniref:hypothetical protein n=1 Tax=Methyloglobulus sp. TaxID=2518622 RepID=UPI0039897AE4
MPTKYTALKDHDTPIKVLFTGYLVTVGIGYMFALIQILLTHGLADGKFGLSVDDIVYSYYGNRSGTVLEQKLNGSMKDNASEQQRFEIMQWVRDGADIGDYKDDGIEKIIQDRCVMCHNKEASRIPNFNDFERLKALTVEDEGATFGSLTRGSHIHMFGISFIFMFVGIIFSFAETTDIKLKCIAIGMPYIFLVTDIVSWWLTKFFPEFAWLIIFAGMGMGVSLMFMWVTSILEMWLYKPVFVDGLGSHYQRWRTDFATSSHEEWFKKLLSVTVGILGLLKRVVGIAVEKWLSIGLPFIQKILKNAIEK